MGEFLIALVLGLTSAPENTVPDVRPSKAEASKQVLLSPLYEQSFTCSQHWAGQLNHLGDALGQDCMILGGPDDGAAKASGFAKLYRNDGKSNEDWYGWGAPVLAPFDGVVRKVHVNGKTNRPGELGMPPASMIVIERADGTSVLYAHLEHIVVEAGKPVKAGQMVALVGNNGYSRSPHVHVGAFRNNAPLQIQWDLTLMRTLFARATETAK